MKEKKKYLYFIMVILSIFIGSCVYYQTYSKYVLTDSKIGFHIDKLMDDKIKPTIIVDDPDSDTEVSLTDEKHYTNEDVKVNFDDNIKVGKAEYWYNEDDEIFEGEGEGFEDGTILTEEGWHKIVITDIFDNTNTVVILIDKTAPTIFADSTNITELKAERSTYSEIDNKEFKQWFISDVNISEYDKYGIQYTCYKVNENELIFNSIESEKEDIGKGRLNNLWTFTDKQYYLITSTDLCKNTSTLVIGIDKVAPVISTLSSNDTKSNKDVKIQCSDDFSGIKNVKYAYNSKNENFTSYTDLTSERILSDDGYYHFILEDVAGNINEYNIVIDKTSPIISLKPDEKEKEEYPNTTSDVIKQTTDFSISTNDNFEIDYNEYWYNPSSNTFSENSTRFDDGKMTEEGYYKFMAHDTFGNTTTIVVLLDKTPPELTVKFYKKTEIGMVDDSKSDLFRNGGIC